jgi:hypothetical protein
MTKRTDLDRGCQNVVVGKAAVRASLCTNITHPVYFRGRKQLNVIDLISF